jgi:glutaredoxin 3
VKASRFARVQVCEALLPKKGVSFKEINVERDPDAARDLVRKTGQSGVPVIKIGGAWIVGFDKERIDRELARRAS